MAIINFKPTTASRRNMSVTDYSVLSKVEPEKSLLAPLNKKAGRNSYGRITVRHRGGGNRRKYRLIDFKRQKHDMPATVLTLEYDPNRSAFIALVQYEDGEKRYILAPNGLKVGDVVVSGPNADIKPGNALPLTVPLSTMLSFIQAKAANWHVLPATWLSSWQRKTAWLCSAFHLASCATCLQPAWLPLVK